LNQVFEMVSIAEPIAKPVSRYRFILDRRRVLGSLFVAPAVLYVLLLVGVPFLFIIRSAPIRSMILRGAL